MITAVDLFCGVGGLTHGLQRAGVRVVAGIDSDPNCRFPYEANNKAAFVAEDVRDVTGASLRRLWNDGTTTLLAGCAPCQAFSTYGRRKGTVRPEEKWSLVAEFGRLVEDTQPDFVTMENVPQLPGHPVLTRFIQSLTGYRVWSDVVQCADYGIPQTRKRLVLLASRTGIVTLETARRLPGAPTVRNAIGHLPSLAAGESDAGDPMHSACSLTELNLRRIRASLPGGTWREWDESLLAACHRGKSGETFPSVYGRMEWDAPAPTITTQCFGYGNGRFGHPEQDRAISLREAAILQTFPGSYRFLRPGERPKFSTLGRLIGNAVPVRLGEAIGISLTRQVRRRRAA